jgi:hypothetical protein
MNIDKQIAATPSLSGDERARMRSNAERWLESGTDVQRDAATRLLVALDAFEAEADQERVAKIKAMSTSQRIVTAFERRLLTETERKVVQALLDNPDSSSTVLSTACGWKGQIWHEKFGTMCAKRGADLWPAPYAETRDAPFYSGILADFDDSSRGFTLKVDAVEAFAFFGLKAA